MNFDCSPFVATSALNSFISEALLAVSIKGRSINRTAEENSHTLASFVCLMAETQKGTDKPMQDDKEAKFERIELDKDPLLEEQITTMKNQDERSHQTPKQQGIRDNANQAQHSLDSLSTKEVMKEITVPGLSVPQTAQSKRKFYDKQLTQISQQAIRAKQLEQATRVRQASMKKQLQKVKSFTYDYGGEVVVTGGQKPSGVGLAQVSEKITQGTEPKGEKALKERSLQPTNIEIPRGISPKERLSARMQQPQIEFSTEQPRPPSSLQDGVKLINLANPEKSLEGKRRIKITLGDFKGRSKFKEYKETLSKGTNLYGVSSQNSQQLESSSIQMRNTESLAAYNTMNPVNSASHTQPIVNLLPFIRSKGYLAHDVSFRGIAAASRQLFASYNSESSLVHETLQKHRPQPRKRRNPSHSFNQRSFNNNSVMSKGFSIDHIEAMASKDAHKRGNSINSRLVFEQVVKPVTIGIRNPECSNSLGSSNVVSSLISEGSTFLQKLNKNSLGKGKQIHRRQKSISNRIILASDQQGCQSSLRTILLEGLQ